MTVTTPPIFFPRSVDEAVEVLDAYDGTAKIVAGGTAAALMLQQRLIAPQALVSLRDVPGLAGVDHAEGEVRIGALVRHAEAARHPVLRARLPVVARSFAVVGNAQVRAAATVGGVLAEADYASDPPAVMLALDAVVTACSPAGPRQIPMAELVVGFYQTSLGPAELVTDVRVPDLPAGAGSAYLKYTSRSNEDRPCVGVAAVTRADGDGNCTDLRIAVGAASETPRRLGEVERGALGRPLDDATIGELADAYADGIDPVSDVRGSAWYRTEMIRVWVRRAIRAALQRDEEMTRDR